jgi:hypothetical protein
MSLTIWEGALKKKKHVMSVRKIRKSNAAQVPSSTAQSLAAVASHALTLKYHICWRS